MAFQGDSIFWVEVEKIVANPFQPRREFNEDRLRELGDSIRMYGVLQPLTVTRKEVHRDDGTFYTEYELIAGERRLRASRLAGVEQVPVIIRSGEQTEQEKLELAIIENLQREDLNAVDRALAFKQLADAFDLSFTQVAKKVGRSREYVSNSVRLLALPDTVLDSLKRGDLSEGHARTLLMLNDKPEELDVLFREILLKKLSVREVERIARKIATDKVRKKRKDDPDANLIAMEREFTDTLGTRVQIMKTDFGGKLTIDYFTEDELAKLLHVIKSQRSLLEAQVPDGEDGGPVVQSLAEAESALEALSASTPLAAEPDEVTTEPEPESEVRSAEASYPANFETANVETAAITQPDLATAREDAFTNEANHAESINTETEPTNDTVAQPSMPSADPSPAIEQQPVSNNVQAAKTTESLDQNQTESPAATNENTAQTNQATDSFSATPAAPVSSPVENQLGDAIKTEGREVTENTNEDYQSADRVVSEPTKTIALRFHYCPALTLLYPPPVAETAAAATNETATDQAAETEPKDTVEQTKAESEAEAKTDEASRPEDNLYSISNFSI